MKFQHLVLLCLVVPLFGQVKISAPDVSINNDGEAIIKIDFSASKNYEENELISKEGVKEYINRISNHRPRKYQVEGVYDALRHNRRLVISPTASGKSLMLSLIHI